MAFLAATAEADWGSTRVATRGRLLDLATQPAFIAEVDGRSIGFLSYDIDADACEVVALRGQPDVPGAGSALLGHIVRHCSALGLSRLWLITTNDNTPALRWYQRRGFVLVALHRGAVSESRRALKPEIPLAGVDGIDIRDEIELELPAAAWPAIAEGPRSADPGRIP